LGGASGGGTGGTTRKNSSTTLFVQKEKRRRSRGHSGENSGGGGKRGRPEFILPKGVAERGLFPQSPQSLKSSMKKREGKGTPGFLPSSRSRRMSGPPSRHERRGDVHPLWTLSRWKGRGKGRATLLINTYTTRWGKGRVASFFNFP